MKNKKLLSKHIIKESIKNNWKLWTVLTGVLCLFITMITAMSPNMANSGGFGGSVVGMLAQVFFGSMAIMVMLIYAITTANKLVASEVDRGTLSFTLNTPTTRKQIIFSKALFFVGSLLAMAVLVGIFGTVVGLIVNIEFAFGTFWLMILGLFLLIFAISGIGFFASCWFNKSSQALILGAGLPVAFYLLNTMSPLLKINGSEFLKYFSLNTLFDTSAIITGSATCAIMFVAMAVIGMVLYGFGIFKFLKKDLPL